MVISCRAEYRVEYITFFLAPLYHGCHHLYDDILVQASHIISQHTKLANTCAIQLLELIQEGCDLAFYIIGIKTAHKRMRRPDESALGSRACGHHLFNTLQLFSRIQLSPLIGMVRIVFRRKHISRHLKFPAEFHEGDPVLVRPRYPIISLDEPSCL